MSNDVRVAARKPQSVSTNAQRQARFSESQRSLGLVRCAVWIPASDVQAFRESAEQLTAAHLRRTVLGEWADSHLGCES